MVKWLNKKQHEVADQIPASTAIVFPRRRFS
jgi:hypothetical protein